MKLARVGVLAIAVSLSSPALADDASPDATQPEQPDATQPDPSQAPASDSTAIGRWPRSVILRPLTLPSGVFMPGADLKTYLLNDATGFFDPATLRVLFGYGITDDLEIAFADYTFASDAAGDGRIAANLGYKILRGAAGGKLEMIARVQGGYGLAETVNAMMESEGALLPLNLGVHVQYNLNDKLCLITPGQQISIGLTEGNRSALDLPVGVGYQATPELYTQLDTSLAHINLHGDATTVIFADTTPVTLTAIYNAMPELDVLAAIGTDVSNDPDQYLTLLVGVRYYAGSL